MNLQRMIALFMDYCLSKQLRPKNLSSWEPRISVQSGITGENTVMLCEQLKKLQPPHKERLQFMVVREHACKMHDVETWGHHR